MLVLVALFTPGCARLGQKRYHLAGVVQEIRDGGQYVVAHEDIPGFMPAMTMPFHVRSAQGAVQPGDKIDATLVVTDKESWLEDLTVKAHGLPTTKSGSGLQPTGAAVGDLVGDFGLVNQDGRAIHLGEYRGRTLVLTFIYTRCPLPEFCPLMTVEEALAEIRRAAS